MSRCVENARSVLQVHGAYSWDEERTSRHLLQVLAHSLHTHRAFMLLNVQELVRKVEAWRELLPRITPYYVVKCNYNPLVIDILAALGLGFSCATDRELEMILELKIDLNRIMLSQPVMSHSTIMYSCRNCVDLLTFDGDLELYKLKSIFPRARCDEGAEADSRAERDGRLGCCVHTEAPHLLRIAKQLNLKVVGVSFHVGGERREAAAHRRAIAAAAALFPLGLAMGHPLRLLNVGGGFPSDMDTAGVSMAREIMASLKQYFPAEKGVRVIAEPGSYLVKSAFTLACPVHSARRPSQLRARSWGRGEEADGEGIHYYLDTGVHGLAASRFTAAPEPLEELTGEVRGCTLWGDWREGEAGVVARLPPLPVPSWLVFRAQGAWVDAAARPGRGRTAAQRISPNSFVAKKRSGIEDVTSDTALTEHAFITECTWEKLKDLKIIKEKKRVRRIFIPNEMPTIVQVYTPILPDTPAQQLISAAISCPAYKLPASILAARHLVPDSPLYQKASPTSTVSSPGPTLEGTINTRDLMDALRTCTLPLSPTSPGSILKSRSSSWGDRFDLNSDLTKKNVRFMPSPDTGGGMKPHDAPSTSGGRRCAPLSPPACITPPMLKSFYGIQDSPFTAELDMVGREEPASTPASEAGAGGDAPGDESPSSPDSSGASFSPPQERIFGC